MKKATKKYNKAMHGVVFPDGFGHDGKRHEGSEFQHNREITRASGCSVSEGTKCQPRIFWL